MPGAIEVRAPAEQDRAQLARLWHDGWHDAHDGLVPDELMALRTHDTFTAWLSDKIANMRVMGPLSRPLGFYVLEGEELEQFFVTVKARGEGMAQVLLSDAERTLLQQGITHPFLSCVVGNVRAARFYEKHGWVRSARIVNEPAIGVGGITIPVWHYVKQLG